MRKTAGISPRPVVVCNACAIGFSYMHFRALIFRRKISRVAVGISLVPISERGENDWRRNNWWDARDGDNLGAMDGNNWRGGNWGTADKRDSF